jgi:hypothetical protein
MPRWERDSARHLADIANLSRLARKMPFDSIIQPLAMFLFGAFRSKIRLKRPAYAGVCAYA